MTWPSSSSIATFGPLPGSLSSHNNLQKATIFPAKDATIVGRESWISKNAGDMVHLLGLSRWKAVQVQVQVDKEITDSELRRQNHEKEGQVQVRVNNLLVNFIVVCPYPPAACKSPGLVLSFDVSYKFWIHSHLLPGNLCWPSPQILILLGDKMKQTLGNIGRKESRNVLDSWEPLIHELIQFQVDQAINWVPHVLLEEAIGLKISKSTYSTFSTSPHSFRDRNFSHQTWHFLQFESLTLGKWCVPTTLNLRLDMRASNSRVVDSSHWSLLAKIPSVSTSLANIACFLSGMFQNTETWSKSCQSQEIQPMPYSYCGHSLVFNIPGLAGFEPSTGSHFAVVNWKQHTATRGTFDFGVHVRWSIRLLPPDLSEVIWICRNGVCHDRGACFPIEGTTHLSLTHGGKGQAIGSTDSYMRFVQGSTSV